MSVGMPGYNATASDIKAASSANPASSSDSSQQVTTASAQAQSPEMTVMAEGDTPLPEKVAYVPVAKPGATFPVAVPPGSDTIAGNTPQPLVQPAQTAAETDAVAQKIAAADASTVAPKTDEVARHDDRAIQDVFFNTYPEKVWSGQSKELVRLNSLLAKVERRTR